MKRRRQRNGTLVVRRTFEPGRLSPVWVVAAYERVVARHIRVVRATTVHTAARGQAQRQVGGPVR